MRNTLQRAVQCTAVMGCGAAACVAGLVAEPLHNRRRGPGKRLPTPQLAHDFWAYTAAMRGMVMKICGAAGV